jgi:pimeloyl-ACP methyl ester carboxylesterase
MGNQTDNSSDAIVKIHSEHHGSGERVFGATGWTVPSPADFLDVLPRSLAARRLTTFHYRDTGRSPASIGFTHSIPYYARDLIHLIDSESVERPRLIGIGGMGAIVMMEVATQIPDRVASLVLHQGWARCDPMLRWQIESMQHLLRDSGFEAYQKLAAALCYTPEYMKEHESEILSRGWTKLRDHKATHLAFMDSCLQHDVRDRLQRIKAPTLIVTGDATDYITGDRLIGEIKDGIPHAEVHVMKGVPHSFNQSPEFIADFDRVVGAFWDRNRL